MTVADEVRDIVAEFDRQIASTLRMGLHGKRTLERLIETAERVQRLVAAKETWEHYGHRAARPPVSTLTKGAEKTA